MTIRRRFENIGRSYASDLLLDSSTQSLIHLYVRRTPTAPESIIEFRQYRQSIQYQIHATGAALFALTLIEDILTVFKENPYLTEAEFLLVLNNLQIPDTTETSMPTQQQQLRALSRQYEYLCRRYIAHRNTRTIRDMQSLGAKILRYSSGSSDKIN